MTSFDRKELMPFFQGLVLGVLIMGALVGIGLAMGLYHGLWFGVPRQ
jgi:hypothetical protein